MNFKALAWFNNLRSSIPFITVLFLVILSSVPFGLPYYSIVTPFFALIAVYFWAIYRNQLLPVWSVFLLGVLQDLLTGSPIGITSLILVLVWFLAVSQRRFILGQSFAVEWVGFVLIAMGAEIIFWILGSIYRSSMLWSEPFIIQMMLTATLYPIFSWLFAQSARLTPRTQP